MAYINEEAARIALCDVGDRMYKKGFVAANDGNISVKIADDVILCTPTGVSKGYMTPDMMVKVDLEGKVLSGTLQPSSELKMHLRVYQENAQVQAVTHAHPPMATAFAVAGIPLDQNILPETVIQLGTVPIAPYATPGTFEVPDSIAPFCNSHVAVLLQNHGALTWGTHLMEAYFRMETLEYFANMVKNTSCIIGQAVQLNETQVHDLLSIRDRMGLPQVPIQTTFVSIDEHKNLNLKNSVK